MNSVIITNQLPPTTGVLTGHAIDWDGIGQDYISLNWEAHMEKCEKEEHDDCCIDDQWDRHLYGDWHKDSNGLWAEGPSKDKEPEWGFSAIYNSNENTLQVSASRWVAMSHHCSPCYPNQADLDTEGINDGYCLSPYCLTNEWLKENGHRLWLIKFNGTMRKYRSKDEEEVLHG